jgi:GntR family transcriptional regulator/MocR family aminotransferase
MAAVSELRRSHDVHSGIIDQLTMAELIRSGRFDRHVRRARLAYRRRRDHLVATLAHRIPHLGVTDLPAGLHAVVDPPPGLAEDAVVERAAACGLALTPLGELSFGPRGRGPALVVGYATPPAHAYAGAVSRLAAVLSELATAPG